MTDTKWLMASDIHFPAHDQRLVNIWLDVLAYFKPDAVDLLGDIDNADSTSRWLEGTSKSGFSKDSDDIRLTREFLADVAGRVKKSTDLHMHDGNHGWHRHVKWLDKNQPNTIADGVYTPETIYEYDKHGWTWHNYDEPPVKRFGDVYAHHGVSISQHTGESVKKDVLSMGVSLVRGHCFSADTEILTRDGWRAYTEISVGDFVYTLNRETNRGEWQAITEKFIYDDFDSLLHIKSRDVDLLVTDGHGMVYGKPGNYKESTAADLAGKSRKWIPLAAEEEWVGFIDASDEEIRMLAWIVAEGNFDPYGNNGAFRVRLSQSDAPDGRMQRLEKLFEDLGWKWNPILRYAAGSTEHGQFRNLDAYRITCLRSDSLELVSFFINPDKTLNVRAMGMSARQAKIYLEEYIWADGSKNSSATNSYQIASNNYKNISDLQALAVRAGYRSSISGPRQGVYYLTYNTRQGSTISPSKQISRVDYEGEVWCVTVPNHTVAVRRNGKTAITMNSHRLGNYSLYYPLTGQHLRGWEIGHLCNPGAPEMQYDRSPNWTPGFAVGLVSGNSVHIQLIEIINYEAWVFGKKFTG